MTALTRGNQQPCAAHATRSSSWLPVGSALVLGLLFVAGPAHAQAAPAADPPPPAAPADAAPTTLAPTTAPATPAPTTAPAPPAPATAPATPAPAISGPTSTRAEVDPLAEQIRREIAAAPQQIAFHGYLRSGFGINSKGGDQDAFQAPGAGGKYRLGNEPGTYGEIALDNVNWLTAERDAAWFKVTVRIAFTAPGNNTADVLDRIWVREAYAQAGHVVPSQPEMTLWAGQRFYRRRDVHILDFFLSDMSGYGAGFEEVAVGGNAKLAVAYLGGSIEIGDDASARGRPVKNTLDLRLYDMPVAGGRLELWLMPVVGIPSDTRPPDENRSGFGGGVFWTLPFMDGFNEISASFGIAGAANLSASLGGAASDGWQMRVVDRAAIQASPRLSMMWTGVVQLDNRNGGTDGSSGNLWLSFGARPVLSFSKYTGIAVEGGVDIVNAEAPGTDTGVLAKLTVAPLLRPGMDFWARPELRAFVTAAVWNDALRGTGGAAYATDTLGLTAGVQMESWW